MDAVGFYQWLNVFHGQIFEAKRILPSLKDGDFDIIHLRLTQNNLPLISSIRSCIGEKSGTKLVVSMDYPVEYWKKKFFSMDKVKTAVQKADFVFATEHTICRALEKSTGKSVYELPYPVDIEKFAIYASHDRDRILNVLYKQKMTNFRSAVSIAKRYNLKLRVVFYRQYDEKLIQKLIKKKIEVVICRNEADFCKALAAGEIVIAPHAYHNYGKWIIYAAAVKTIAAGNFFLDAARRCYPMISSINYRSLQAYEHNFLWLMKEQGISEYIREEAFHKVQYYNWPNMQNRFLHLLAKATQETRFEKYYNRIEVKTDTPVFARDIQYIDGKTVLSHKKNELTVVCLVKNGMEHLDTFLNHYQELGVKHFLFIDNGSTDGTVDFLKNRNNITLYWTTLPHKHYESEIRRTIIENLCSNSWCLCVDIDELFDYPYSNKVALAHFLEYLNQYQYTAVISYMLDMFPRELAASNPDDPGALVRNNCYYDISDIKKDNYYNHNNSLCNYNRLADKAMPYYYGGIRHKYFGKKASKYLLIKHPLMFIDQKIEPVTDPHFCNKAYVADVSCLLKHYKFTNSFKERLNKIMNDYGYFGMLEHQEYYKILKEQENVNFYSTSAKKLEDINDLLKSGFIKISKQYLDFINNLDCKSSNN
jgi:hypothetical protein